MLRTGLKILGALLLVVVVAAGGLLLMGSRNLATSFEAPPETLEVPADSASLALGRRLVGVYGCTDCHGPDLSGTRFIEGMPFMDLPAPNLTPAGVGGDLGPLGWERAIRHGIGADGRPLLIMPSESYQGMSDEDLGAMVAYLESLPSRSSDLMERRVGPVGRIVAAVDPDGIIMGRLVDHDAPHPETKEPTQTAAYGGYLIPLCTGCHGMNLAGGTVPGTDGVAAPALRPPSSAMAGWSRDDFFRAMRRGERPDGSALGEHMPWQAFRHMTDTELGALWLHLQALEPAAAE